MEYCLIPISFSAACSPSRCNTRWGLRGFSRDIKEPSNDETWVESISHSTKRIKIGMFYINTGATHKERNNYYLFTTLIFHEWNWLFLLFMRKSIEKIHYLHSSIQFQISPQSLGISFSHKYAVIYVVQKKSFWLQVTTFLDLLWFNTCRRKDPTKDWRHHFQ